MEEISISINSIISRREINDESINSILDTIKYITMAKVHNADYPYLINEDYFYDITEQNFPELCTKEITEILNLLFGLGIIAKVFYKDAEYIELLRL